MTQEWQLALLDRMLAHHQAGNTTDMADDVYRNRVDKYVRADRLDAEVDKLFSGLPVLACMTPDVPRPGDYMTLSIADVPVLVARGEDGVVRAFRNVCRHRGACVAEGRGHTDKTFMCPYHAWSYRLDGSLVAMTHRAGFAGVDKTEHGLTPVACGEAAGFVFVHLDGEPATFDAAAWLGGAREELATFGFENYFRTETRTTTREMNWKLMFDTFGEVYHVQHLHRNTIHPLIQSDNALYDAWETHGRMAVARWPLDAYVDQPRDEWDLLPAATLVYHMVPNTVVIQQVDHLEVYQIFPDGPNRCTGVVSLYAPEEPTTDKARDYWKKNFDLLMQVTETEDFVMCEQMQRAFAAGAQEYIQFGRNEPALTHYHRTLDRLLGLETPVGVPTRSAPAPADMVTASA
ncbi:MAG: aromatic ring-hydroxylating dioxygenase subunit alpha [Acidimicrobiales bacterium]